MAEDIDEHKGQMILANITVTEWAGDFFGQLRRYIDSHQDGMLYRKGKEGSETYERAKKENECLRILLDAGIVIGELDTSSRTKESYKKKTAPEAALEGGENE